VCTGDDGRESCVPPGRGLRSHPDQPGGRDIAGNEFLGEALMGALATTKFTDINARIASGLLSYLIEIRHYSGAPDQRALSVAFYDSHGLYRVDDGGIVNIAPSWNGTDEWTLDCRLSGAFCNGSSTEVTWLGDGGFASGSVDSTAHVTGNVLVARFPAIVLDLGLTTLAVSRVILTATISAAEGGYRLDGQIAGRVTTQEAFASVARLRGTSDAPLCGSDERFQMYVRPKICEAADIASHESNDDQKAPCDALSVALSFRALPARVGYRFDSDPLPQGCDGSIANCNND
jgi:hypothetical protein